MILNGQKGFKMYKMVKNGRNGKKLPKKWSKMVENGPNGRKWSKWSKMVKNGGPDLKQAQCTGLSARRARRTKSRGSKGLQLEVGARRAPRLLVQYKILILCGIVLLWCVCPQVITIFMTGQGRVGIKR